MSIQLPEEDTQFLDTHFFGMWEPRELNGEIGLVIENYPLPKGYTLNEVCLMVLVPVNYALTGLDMFYTRPNVERSDGKAIEALATEVHLGESWQRWSRHYHWNSSEDDLARHMMRIKGWLEREIQL